MRGRGFGRAGNIDGAISISGSPRSCLRVRRQPRRERRHRRAGAPAATRAPVARTPPWRRAWRTMLPRHASAPCANVAARVLRDDLNDVKRDPRHDRYLTPDLTSLTRLAPGGTPFDRALARPWVLSGRLTGVPRTALSRWTSAGLLVVMAVSAPTPVAAQEPAPADPPAVVPVVSERTLEQIRTALASDARLTPGANALRFYSTVTVTWPTFAEYLQGVDARLRMARPTPYAAPGERPALGAGMGVDLLGLASSAIRGVRAVQQRRRARAINEQIDRELAAIEQSRQ